MTQAVEANFDGLVGPTHTYGGLSHGNLASASNAASLSNPREAALQGLEKAWMLASSGLVQGVLPPHQRPFLPALRALGFAGSDRMVLEQAAAAEPVLLRQMCSSAQMWAANAATVSPSADCADGRLHATPANLHTMAHRAIEAGQTTRTLRRLLPDPALFAVHDPLPHHALTADEGAANHMRLCADFGAQGVEVFVWGRDGQAPAGPGFPARQTLQTGTAVARRHGLDPARTVHLRQSRRAIDAGAFHNDVVAVASRTVLFCHEHAFEDRAAAHGAIRTAASGLLEPVIVEVSEAQVPLADAVRSYLFNTQLLALPGEDRLVLVAPVECRENPATRAFLETMVAGNGPVGRVLFVDVRQSMRNGGGPACLRQRIVLTPQQRAALGGRMMLDAALLADLRAWVVRHYRDRLAPEDLADPQLMDESYAALDALTGILDLGSDFYPFQRS